MTKLGVWRVAAAIALAVALALPGPAALAQLPTDDVPDPCDKSTPTPTPTPTPTETPTPTPTPTESPTPTPSPTPTIPDCPEPSPSPSPEPSPSPGDGDSKNQEDSKDGEAQEDLRGNGNKKDDEIISDPAYLRLEHAYSTDVIFAVAAQLRALGWSQDDIIPRVYAPFIVGGEANWIDTWGAPRFGPGATVRRHEGQDVFCDYGDPVLAAEKGVVDYDEGGLGGIVARLHRSDGGYWYYAHLSATNDAEFPSGTRVKPGDVIGFCGNTGNALTTPPHVHFGWYQADGTAKDPMRVLVRWLREARGHSLVVLAAAQGKRLAQIDTLMAARQFGDAFTPSLAEVKVNAQLEALAEQSALRLIGESAVVAGITGEATSTSSSSKAPVGDEPALTPDGAVEGETAD